MELALDEAAFERDALEEGVAAERRKPASTGCAFVNSAPSWPAPSDRWPMARHCAIPVPLGLLAQHRAGLCRRSSVARCALKTAEWLGVGEAASSSGAEIPPANGNRRGGERRVREAKTAAVADLQTALALSQAYGVLAAHDVLLSRWEAVEASKTQKRRVARAEKVELHTPKTKRGEMVFGHANVRPTLRSPSSALYEGGVGPRRQAARFVCLGTHERLLASHVAPQAAAGAPNSERHTGCRRIAAREG